MTDQIRQNVISGVKWNGIGQFSRQFISFGVMIVLTRLLNPVEFGQIGILLFFIGISDVFINSGLSTALIQQKSKSTIDYSTVFIFNLTVSLAFYIIFFLGAPLIASYFEQPELTELCRILAFVFIINACGTVQSTILTINLDFRKQNLISVIGVAVSGLFALSMAFNGYKVYSLVGQLLAFALTTNLLLWLTSKWRPKFIFSAKSFKRLFKFGSSILLSSILDKIFTTVDNLIVGKIFNTTQLGFYTRAKSTNDLPIQNTTGILSSVFFPVFSKLNDKDELRRLHLKFIRLIAYLILPLMIGLAIVAEPLTLVLFGEKWLPSSSMLQILAIYGLLYPMSVILVQTLLVLGESRMFLKLDIYKKFILLALMIMGSFHSIEFFLISICIGHYIGFILNLIIVSKTLKLPISSYLTVFTPTIIITLAMALFVIFISNFDFPSTAVKLITQVTTGIISYISLSIIFKIDNFIFFKNLLLKKINRK